MVQPTTNTELRQVGHKLPELLLTQEHHMCPGCGEPLALRGYLEAISELGLASRAIAVAGIGCYTSFSMTMDIDLVQALHGRAPSVATGVKRMRPDSIAPIRHCMVACSHSSDSQLLSFARLSEVSALVRNNVQLFAE